MREFYAHGAVASETLIKELQKDNGKWARAVLSQNFRVPKEYAEALLAGAATWSIKTPSILIIGLEKDASL